MMWRKEVSDISRRDFDFAMERLDDALDRLKAYARLAEAQERAHSMEMDSLKTRVEISEGRLTALDSWLQNVGSRIGTGGPSPSGETVYEGFDDPDLPGDIGDDFSLEEMFSGAGEVPVPSVPQTENSPVVDDLIPSDADAEGVG